MNLLTCSNTVKKNIHGNPDVYMDDLLKKVHGKLINLKVPSEITNGALVFERPIQLFQYDRGILFNPIRKGQIRINKINRSQIEIFWEVELETLWVISITTGLILGFFLRLFVESTGLVNGSFLLIGFLTAIVCYLVGLHSIQTTMNEVLETSV